jgi:hypothetical protein
VRGIDDGPQGGGPYLLISLLPGECPVHSERTYFESSRYLEQNSAALKVIGLSLPLVLATINCLGGPHEVSAEPAPAV